ncbi:MAG: universal stress protein [Caldilineaceae bacterium]
MFHHIVVPVDFTARNKQALDLAVNLAIMSQARVTLLHVIELMQNAVFEDFADFYATLATEADTKLQALVAPYAETTITIDQRVIYGDRVREILRLIQDEKVDLLVMSSHQIDPTDPARGWGSISHKIGILAPCPVLLMK